MKFAILWNRWINGPLLLQPTKVVNILTKNLQNMTLQVWQLLRCLHVFFYLYITHNLADLEPCYVVAILIWPYIMIVFFMLWHFVVAEHFFVHITVVHCFLICVVVGVNNSIFTCLLVSCGVRVTPVSTDRHCFWWFCWFCPPSYLRMRHFLGARHTLGKCHPQEFWQQNTCGKMNICWG